MGELYKSFNSQGRRTDKLIDGAVNKLSQKEVRESAGISERQAATAVRVANVTEGAQLGGKVVCRRDVAAAVRYSEFG
jgi:hypothetical protein